MTQASLLDLIADDHTHASDKAAVITAIREAAWLHGNIISSNEIREHLPPWITPCVVGATISGLVTRKVLTHDGWVESTDRKGRNQGKPVRRYAVNLERLGEG